MSEQTIPIELASQPSLRFLRSKYSLLRIKLVLSEIRKLTSKILNILIPLPNVSYLHYVFIIIALINTLISK